MTVVLVVLVVVIVVLLILLAAGTVVTLRRRDHDAMTSEEGSKALGDVPRPSRVAPETDLSTPEVTQDRRGLKDKVPSPALETHAEPSGTEIVAPPSLRSRLGRARELISAPLTSIGSRGRIDDAALKELEETLILADVGLATTTRLLDALRVRVRSSAGIDSTSVLIDALRDEVLALFKGDDTSLEVGDERPSVWLFVGVNGVGKTTTIGKLARREVDKGQKVVLAAGDTFRAAAGDQLFLWGEKTGASVIRGADGADPSSVVFDAIQHAAARGADLVLADSAGRLHTKTNLMEELKKVRRIAGRPPGHLREVFLVLDATTGQNGLAQAREFSAAVGVTGIVLTKLDGTAKGGIVLAIRSELGIPIKLVGLGEGADDLVEFDPSEFVEALLGQ